MSQNSWLKLVCPILLTTGVLATFAATGVSAKQSDDVFTKERKTDVKLLAQARLPRGAVPAPPGFDPFDFPGGVTDLTGSPGGVPEMISFPRGFPDMKLPPFPGETRRRPFGTASKSFCLGLYEHWLFSMEKFGEDSPTVRQSMLDSNCGGHWGIYIPTSRQ